MSRSWLLYLDDLIASAQKIERLTAARTVTEFASDEAAFDAVLFNLPVIGEAVKKLPDEALAGLLAAHRSGPARMRDLIAHRYFALDPDIVWEVARRHVPVLCVEALLIRAKLDAGDDDPDPAQ